MISVLNTSTHLELRGGDLPTAPLPRIRQGTWPTLEVKIDKCRVVTGKSFSFGLPPAADAIR